MRRYLQNRAQPPLFSAPRRGRWQRGIFRLFLFGCGVGALGLWWPISAFATDKLVGIHSSRTMSQSMPWIAQEAGVFKKYDLDFQLVFIASSGMVTAALLGGDAEMTLTGGVGNVRGYDQGATDRSEEHTSELQSRSDLVRR